MPEYAGIYRHTNRPKTTSQTGQRPSKALTIPTLPSGWEPSPPGTCTCPPIPRIGVGARLPSPGRNQPIHLLIDSTGLRILVGTLRRPPKRRAWRKLHLAVDADTGDILASNLTDRRTADCARVPALILQIDDPVVSVFADGATIQQPSMRRPK